MEREHSDFEYIDDGSMSEWTEEDCDVEGEGSLELQYDGAPSPPPSPPATGDETARILKDAKALGVGSGHRMSFGEGCKEIFSGMKEKLKILITHIQISMSFRNTMDMKWGARFANIDLFWTDFSFVKVRSPLL